MWQRNVLAQQSIAVAGYLPRGGYKGCAGSRGTPWWINRESPYIPTITAKGSPYKLKKYSFLKTTFEAFGVIFDDFGTPQQRFWDALCHKILDPM